MSDILNSVVRYRPRTKAQPDDDEENEETKTKKIRKKMILPSVMTSQTWIDLQKAVEDEKEAIEEQKKLREENRKLKRAELQKTVCIYLFINYLHTHLLSKFKLPT